MHQPIPAGKVVNFRTENFFDTETNKQYSGVYVDAYISKGADNIWQMVLDGTLTGFSVGGNVKDSEPVLDAESQKTVRIIKDYDLVELSLVDSPANQFANIMSVEKVDGMNIIKADETALENVFYDKESGIVMVSENENELSPTTGNQMENIGFVEKTDNEKVTMIKFLVDSAKGINTSKINKEVQPMTKSKTQVEKTDVVEDVVVAPEADASVAEVIEEVDANFLAEQYDIERDILKDSNSHIVSNEEADEDFLSTLEQDEQRYEDAGYKPKGVTQSILDYVEFKGEATYTEMQNFYRITFGSNSFSHILISLVVPYKNRTTRRYLYKTASGKYVVRVAGLHNWVEKDY